jgi:hypothetical protein
MSSTTLFPIFISKSQAVNIQISADKKIVWICTSEDMTVLKISNIKELIITDLGKE